MKRNRNTFFSNYNAQTQGFIPNGLPMQSPMEQNYGPYTASQTSTTNYAGPDISSLNDLDNRLSKIERQINRLDNRLTKLESNNNITNDIKDTYNNMYML